MYDKFHAAMFAVSNFAEDPSDKFAIVNRQK